MTVRSRIEDAVALYTAGRHESALLLALVAAAGTSRKRYPAQQGWTSEAALSEFLSDERLVFFGGEVLNFNVQYAGAMDPKYTDGMVPWHLFLAVFLRNQLVHNSTLAPNVRILGADALSVGIGADGAVEFAPCHILGLIRAIEVARENREEWPEVESMPYETLAQTLFGCPQPTGPCADYLRDRVGRVPIPPA